MKYMFLKLCLCLVNSIKSLVSIILRMKNEKLILLWKGVKCPYVETGDSFLYLILTKTIRRNIFNKSKQKYFYLKNN